MQKTLEVFKKLCEIFETNGNKLYLVGGTVRNFLLGLELDDMDAVTDARPEEMHVILKDLKADYTFEKYGSIKVFCDGIKFDVTTLRKEQAYKDNRHPGKIEFVTSLQEDVVRRDFTVNAMYLDKNFNVIDLVGGQDDLKNKVLKMVGNPDIRLEEDPLRIIRAARFLIDYDFKADTALKESLTRNSSLLEKINPQKIKQDLQKIKNKDADKCNSVFEDLSIKHLIDVLH